MAQHAIYATPRPVVESLTMESSNWPVGQRGTSLGISTTQWSHTAIKGSTETTRTAGCGYNNYQIRAESVKGPAKRRITEKFKAGKQIQALLKYPASTDKKMQETVKIPAKKIIKKPDELYNDAMAFAETSKVSLFNGKTYKVPVLIGLIALRIRPIPSVFDDGACQNLFRANILDPRWLGSVCQCDISEILAAFNAKLTVSGTIMQHLRVGVSHNRVTFYVLDRLAVPVLLGTIFIDRVIRPIHAAERNFFPLHFMLVPILVVYRTRSATEKKEYLTIRQEVEEDLALFVTPTRCDPRNISVARQVLLNAMYKTPVLVSTVAAGIIEVASHVNLPNFHAFKTAWGIMDVFPGWPLYATTASFGMIEVHSR